MSLNTEIRMQEGLYEVLQFKVDKALARVMRLKIKLNERYSEAASYMFGESLEDYNVAQEHLLKCAVELECL